MATARQIAHCKAPIPFPHPSGHKKPRPNPLALWHLLSLDAPTVAVLWTWFLARTNHIHLPWTSIAAMATAVWLLYAADRLLDARQLEAAIEKPSTLEPRHRFHHHHRRAFLTGIAAVTLALAALLPHLDPAAIRLYLIEGSFLVGYFVLIHATRSAHRLPKELAVGLFFAAATFIPTIARNPSLRLPLLAPAILFSALCTLNCLFIYAWEHPASPTASQARPLTCSTAVLKKFPATPSIETTHPATQLALNHLYALTLVLLVTSISLTFNSHRAARQIPAAIGLSTILLLLLHRNRHRLHPTTLRAAADLALLTPLIFLVH